MRRRYSKMRAFGPGGSSAGAGAFLLSSLAALLLVVLAGSLLPPTASAEASNIHWVSYQQALQARQKAEKPRIVFFSAPWCYFCKKMNRLVFKQADLVKDMNLNFLPVLVDVSKDKQTAKAMGISFIPTIIFTDPNGRQLLKLKGYVPPGRFKLALRYVRGGHHKKMGFSQYLDSQP